MLAEAVDLRAEADDFHALLSMLDEKTWWQPTPFKGWTPFDVVAHLHHGDKAATLAIADPPGFQRFLEARKGKPRPASERELVETRDPLVLLATWRSMLQELSERIGGMPPDARVAWVGPPMGVRTFAAARLMEVWAHAQDVYDLLRRPRVHHDRIRAIAELGVRTFGFTFTNRGQKPPATKPYVRLDAPSGAIWEWNPPSESDRIGGSAVEFCQVVTQGRNIRDTKLEVAGDAAKRWMEIAQCFAGAPSDPPKPGERAW
ncbi:MAG TPA: TIGR03084 family metal-binding protein [Burkholderiales bacterium]|nr:TIGR03084 family metal-binding protein [Burkholderiales bacterium]